MCLGIPGRLTEIGRQDDLPMGKVDFGGILKEVCLAYTPEAQVGDYVLVHVGFAISRIDEAEAREIFDFLAEIGNAEEELSNDENKMPKELQTREPLSNP
jgi:hydrogenase expression/formation protein HypC